MGESGFTILEVIVAAIIVGIAVIGVALMFGAGQAFIHAEGDNRIALWLAQQKIEQLRACGFTKLQALPNPGPEDLNVPTGAGAVPTIARPCGSGLAVASLPAYPYRRTWSVTSVNGDDYTSACAGLCALRIHVLVEPSPVDPKAGAVELDAIVANR
jgi:type II secretory pathway pseudopilin PulG